MGERDHFEAAFRRNRRLISRTLAEQAVPLDHLEDAVQEVFLAAYRRWSDRAGPLAERAWLRGIARTVALSFRRSRARTRRKLWAFACRSVGTPAPTPEDATAHAEVADLLSDFLQRLEPNRRNIFLMAEVEQRTAPEIAAFLDVSVNTVYSRLRLARRAFDTYAGRLQARERRYERSSHDATPRPPAT